MSLLQQELANGSGQLSNFTLKANYTRVAIDTVIHSRYTGWCEINSRQFA